MRVVMLFILLCIKLGFPKFFKFYEFLKSRFPSCRRQRSRKKTALFFKSLSSFNKYHLTQATMFYNRTAELEYYRNGMVHEPTTLEFWTAWFVFCSFFSVIAVCIMYPNGAWFQALSGATLVYLFWQVVVNYVDCE
ncbi:hypothetical protein V8C35DRAFT_333944 [Trichoderma chlorosporum]